MPINHIETPRIEQPAKTMTLEEAVQRLNNVCAVNEVLLVIAQEQETMLSALRHDMNLLVASNGNYCRTTH